MSWFISPLLKLGFPQLAAARMAMGFSALLFLAAESRCTECSDFRKSGFLRRNLDSGMRTLLVGAVYHAGPASSWTGRHGCVLLDKGTGISDRLERSGAGALWALAYLAKAVAFPLAILTTLSLGGLVLIKHKSLERASCARKMLTTLLAFALVAGPWVEVLSIKYGRPTFSTAARISHALTGPSDSERYHPFARTFHRPEPGESPVGRPSNMAYNFWSPFQSPAYAWQQVQLVVRNLLLFLLLLTSLNFAWVFVPLDTLQARRGNNREHPTPQYFQASMVPLWLLLLYLPASSCSANNDSFIPLFRFCSSLSLCGVEPA